MDASRACTTQFIINNLPEEQREHLMKKDVREEICKYADVNIAIRGRFYSPKDDTTNIEKNRLLHLHISGPSKENLSQATSKIEALLGIKTDDKPINNEEEPVVEEKITIGVDLFPSIFRMKARMLGDNEENVKYIALETKADISLRGKGAGHMETADEPLHIFVTYRDASSHDDAQKLILNLIETVQQDFIKAYGKYYPAPKKPEVITVKPKVKEKVKSVSPPKEEPKSTKPVVSAPAHDTEKISLGFSHVPIKFNLKSKIYGPNLSNVKHIEKVSSAVVLVEGVSSGFSSDKVNTNEAPFILVKYLKPEKKEMARGLILNLIETIHQEFTTLYGAHLSKPKKPEILPLKTTPKFPKPSAPDTFPKSLKLSPPIDARKPARKDSPVRRPFSPGIGPVPPPPPVISKAVSPQSAKFTANNSVNGVQLSRKPPPKEIKPIRITFPKANPPKTVPPANALFNDEFSGKERNEENFKSHDVGDSSLNNRSINTPYTLQNTNSQNEPVRTLNVRHENLSHRPQNVQPENKYFPANVNLPTASFAVPNLQPPSVPYTNRSFEPPPPNISYPPITTSQHSVPYPVQNVQPANISFMPRNVHPMPSIVPPMSGINSQVILDQSQNMPPNSGFLSAPPMNPIRENNAQYFKKRSNSPVETRPDNKRFCTNMEDASGQITSFAVHRDQISLKTKNTSNRYLVPLQSIDSVSKQQKQQQQKQQHQQQQQQRNPHQLQSETVLSFLNECAKASTKPASVTKIYDKMSDDDDVKSVILIDSEEETLENEQQRDRKSTNKSISTTTRTIGVQTSVPFRESCVKCACGRFSRSLTTVRTVGIQTSKKMTIR